MGFTVAIDGPAAAGKGTVGRAVAQEFGFDYLDTGVLYRAVGRRVLAGEDPVIAAKTLRDADMKGADLRQEAVAEAASTVAPMPLVRAALMDFQRDFARAPGGAVLDGRDIGTVICPDADVKLFITADARTRAERRLQELLTSGAETTFDAVLADVLARDRRDGGRAVAPMRAAKDAVLIDTTDLSIERAVKRACDVVRARLSAAR